MPAIVNAYNQPKAPKEKSSTPKECKVSRDEFVRNATIVPVALGQGTINAKPFDFSTGSFGWFGNGKVTVKLANGDVVDCQAESKLVVLHSKNAPPAVLGTDVVQ